MVMTRSQFFEMETTTTTVTATTSTPDGGVATARDREGPRMIGGLE